MPPDHAGKEELASWLLSHKEEVVFKAEQPLADSGCEADVDLNLSHDHFPARTYGNAFFPCGYYDAARITIGKGKDATVVRPLSRSLLYKFLSYRYR